MKRYNAIQAVVLSLFSPSFYRDVGQHWRGTGFGYLFLLLAVLWIPVMVKWHGAITRSVAEHSPAFINQIPAITIAHGVVSADCTMPYVIKEPSSQEPLVIIDTTGATTSLANQRAGMLLTRSKFIVRQGPSETRAYDLSKIDDFKLDHNRVQRWANQLAQYLATGLYPFILLASYVYRMIQTLIYALIGLLFAKLLHATVDYNALVRLSAFALTPVLLLCTVQEILTLPLTGWWLICLVVAMVYLFLAVKANAGTPSAPPPSQPAING